MLVRLGVCIALGIVAVILQGMSIAYLRDEVFSPDALSTYGLGDAACNVYLTFELLSWFAALEVLVISGHMVTVQRKHHPNKGKVGDVPLILSFPLSRTDGKPRNIGLFHQPLRDSPPILCRSIRPRTWCFRRDSNSGNIPRVQQS